MHTLQHHENCLTFHGAGLNPDQQQWQAADYPYAAARLEWHLAASQQLLWGLLHPQHAPNPGPPPYLEDHPVPGKPYFPWETMASVVPSVQGGRYLEQRWEQLYMGGQPAQAAGQGVQGAVGLAPGPPRPAWQFQAPTRGTRAYVQRLEMMQGPHWRPADSTAAQGVTGSSVPGAAAEEAGGHAAGIPAPAAAGAVAGSTASAAVAAVPAGGHGQRQEQDHEPVGSGERQGSRGIAAMQPPHQMLDASPTRQMPQRAVKEENDGPLIASDPQSPSLTAAAAGSGRQTEGS